MLKIILNYIKSQNEHLHGLVVIGIRQKLVGKHCSRMSAQP